MQQTSSRLHLPRPLGFAIVMVLLGAAGPRALCQEPSPPAKPSSVDRAARLKQSTDLKAKAETLRLEKMLDDAAATAGQALTIDRSLFGETSPQVVDTLTLLARIDERREEWDAAAKAREEVLAVRLKQVGAEHWQTADARRALGYTATLRGLDAEKRKAIWAADDQDDEVARLVVQKKVEDAVKLATESVARRKEVLGATHWQVGEALHRLGRLHLMNGKWDASRSVNEEALAIRRKTLGESHPDTGRSWFNLGQALSNLAQVKPARKAFENAVSIWRASLGDEDALIDMGLDPKQALYIR